MKQLIWDLISAFYIMAMIGVFAIFIIVAGELQCNYGEIGFNIFRGLGMFLAINTIAAIISIYFTGFK